MLFESHTQVETLKSPPHLIRLWRPAAQRNLRNQWSKLNSLGSEWHSTVSDGCSHAMSLVNCYLSQKYQYMDGIDFGVLTEMLPTIRTKACHKLFKQQEAYRGKLLSCYKDMVAVVIRMVNVCKSMRCYFKGGPVAQFSFTGSENDDDSGECGGISVFTFLSITAFEELAWEIVQMFIAEVKLKRLIVMELVSISDEKVGETSRLLWSDEFYEGEFENLSACNLFSVETQEPVLPGLDSSKSSVSSAQNKRELNSSNVLQVYLTTWAVEASIDRCRVDEILGIVGEEMHVDFLAKSGP